MTPSIDVELFRPGRQLTVWVRSCTVASWSLAEDDQSIVVTVRAWVSPSNTQTRTVDSSPGGRGPLYGRNGREVWMIRSVQMHCHEFGSEVDVDLVRCDDRVHRPLARLRQMFSRSLRPTP